MDLAGITRHEPVTVSAGRRAAVIAPVAFRDEWPHILSTERADHLGEHPGRVSFPGGGREPSDADLWATAFRESSEEIGLRSGEAAFHGRLDDTRTATDYAVSPFVATVPDRAYEPDQRKVAEVAVLAVGDPIDRANYESKRRDHPQYGETRLHFSHVDGYTVWGAAGRMLVQLFELTTDWRVPKEVDRAVDPDTDYPV